MLFRSIEGRLPLAVFSVEARDAYREARAWRHTLRAYRDAVERLVEKKKPVRSMPRVLVVDVSNSSQDPANSGVVRVTRQLTAELRARGEFTIFFVYWDAALGDYRFVVGARKNFLALNSGPRTGLKGLLQGEAEPTPAEVLHRIAPGRFETTLFVPEVAMDGQLERRIEWARARNISVAAVLYDVIPIDYPQYCSADLVEIFPTYAAALAGVDTLFPISRYSLERFNAFCEDRGLAEIGRAHV